MNVLFWAIDPRVAFWTRFEANFRLGRNQGPLFLNGLASPRVPGQLRSKIITSSPSAIIAAPPFQFRWEGWCTMGRPQEPIVWGADCWVTGGILLRTLCRFRPIRKLGGVECEEPLGCAYKGTQSLYSL